MTTLHNNLEVASACKSCSASSACGVGVVSKLFNKRTQQTVIEPIGEGEFITKVFLLYIMPLLFVIAGAGVAEYLYPGNTLIALGFSLVFFILGIALLFLWRKR